MFCQWLGMKEFCSQWMNQWVLGIVVLQSVVLTKYFLIIFVCKCAVSVNAYWSQQLGHKGISRLFLDLWQIHNKTPRTNQCIFCIVFKILNTNRSPLQNIPGSLTNNWYLYCSGIVITHLMLSCFLTIDKCKQIMCWFDHMIIWSFCCDSVLCQIQKHIRFSC